MGNAAKQWGRGWWGISFLLFFGMIYWMGRYRRLYYTPICKELGMMHMTGFSTRNMPEVERLIAQTSPRLWD